MGTALAGKVALVAGASLVLAAALFVRTTPKHKELA